MGIRDKIVTRISTDTKGCLTVHTASGVKYGPFKDEYDMSKNSDIGQRALNWLNAQGGRRVQSLRGDSPG